MSVQQTYLVCRIQGVFRTYAANKEPVCRAQTLFWYANLKCGILISNIYELKSNRTDLLGSNKWNISNKHNSKCHLQLYRVSFKNEFCSQTLFYTNCNNYWPSLICKIQLFKAFRITGSSGSVDGICWKIIKQTVHFGNLTCVILTSTLLKFVADFSNLSAGW